NALKERGITIPRTEVYYYMSALHIFPATNCDSEEPYFQIHHKLNCEGTPAVESHETLYDFWRGIKHETESQKADNRRNQRLEQIAEQDEKKRLTSEKNFERALKRATTQLGTDLRALSYSWRYFSQLHGNPRYNGRQIYALLFEYLQSKDKGEKRIWQSLSDAAGLPYASTARLIIMQLGLNSLTKQRSNTQHHRTSLEWRQFTENVKSLPLKPSEIVELSDWPSECVTLQRALHRKRGRVPSPWRSEGSSRAVPDYRTAAAIYQLVDEGYQREEIAEKLDRNITYLSIYLQKDRMKKARMHLSQLAELNRKTLEKIAATAQAPHQAP
ncbi:MAG TPA: hypothetical protein VI934_04885, partial [Candidatus Nanoarchaeia archaeon]|nr:hypothetical protein [Candidatus Nanoarchaeia archaeon]